MCSKTINIDFSGICICRCIYIYVCIRVCISKPLCFGGPCFQVGELNVDPPASRDFQQYRSNNKEEVIKQPTGDPWLYLTT